MTWDWSLDGWIVMTGCLCAMAAALLGNFLVLRQMSMLGDAVSHAILPGLAVAFLVSESRSSLPMFVGAVLVGILTATFTEWIKRWGRVDEGASMGVVFTSLFAAGLVMIVQAADHVDLDASCVLYGAIELTPNDMVSVGTFELPRSTLVLGIVALVNVGFVAFFYKELKITTFDPALADSMGISTRWMHNLLMVLVAVTAVASFESVGNILVVAMLIVPPATAFLLSRRLGPMILLSIMLAIIAVVTGHLAALTVPRWFGFGSATTAPMMAVMTGVLFAAAFLFSPQQGLVVGAVRRWSISQQILCDDLLAYLYRVEERQANASVAIAASREEMLSSTWRFELALWRLRRRGEVRTVKDRIELLEAGRVHGSQLVRSHRLWEQYLVTETDTDARRIHDKAEKWEHYTTRQMRDRLDEAMAGPTIDPHGSAIPPEDASDK